MDAPRSRFHSLFEWAIAAAVTAAIVIVGSLVFREVRTIHAVVPVSAVAPPDPDVPAGVPSRAVSVPVLPLPDGTAIRLGEREADVVRRLGREAHVTSEAVDRAGVRERVTRGYSYTGVEFVLVFEAATDTAEPHVSAIYLR